jgi:hypothetical protein
VSPQESGELVKGRDVFRRFIGPHASQKDISCLVLDVLELALDLRNYVGNGDSVACKIFGGEVSALEQGWLEFQESLLRRDVAASVS